MVSEYVKFVLDNRNRPLCGYEYHIEKVGSRPVNDTYFLRGKALRFFNIADERSI